MVDIADISVLCRVSLGRLELSASEYEQLRIGDVLVLDQKVTDPLPFYVEDQPLLWVRPGLEGIRKAVVVDERANS